MSPIAIFYHCCFSSPCGRVNPETAIELMADQMAALTVSGLADAASEIHIYCQGGEENLPWLRELSPEKSVLHFNHSAISEVPTIYQLQQWLPGHEHWVVFYHHIKGITKKDGINEPARLKMTAALVDQWRRCVKDLDNGFDAVGINLVHPEKRPVFPGCFFAGNFWWARVVYLQKLPPMRQYISHYSNVERCEAEHWIGKAWKHGKFMDYEREKLWRNNEQ